MIKNAFLILIVTLVSASSVISQTVNDTPIKDIDVEFVQIVGTSKLFKNKVTIQLDFGQSVKFFSSGKETQIKDENGKRLSFNSMIDALNFMSKNGYDFVHAYAITIGNQNVYHYLLQKRKV
jgi:hypothetical protein